MATIDLHLHTTASDGRCTPAELVDRAAAAGIRVMSVTDHDTRAAEASVRSAAEARGIEFIPGIEVTAVHGGKDVHVLGYGLPPEVPGLDAVLADQRRRRVERAREIAERLARLSAPIDVDALIASASSGSGKAIARPQIAAFLVAAGHVSSVAEAFDRYLDERSPAYVPHTGVSPIEIVVLITGCGGVASLAHPGQLKKDHLIGELVDAGMPCLEVYHSSHPEDLQQHYGALARRFGLGATGGSDFHGEGTRRSEFFGVAGLPPSELERFREILAAAAASAAAVPVA